MFLIDCFPDYQENCLKLWLFNGNSMIEKVKFLPCIYVKAHKGEDALISYLKENSSVESFHHEKRFIDFKKKSHVIKIVLNTYNVKEISSEIGRLGDYEFYELFNVDLTFPQRYFFENESFPMMNTKRDSYFALEYEVPPLRELSFDIVVDSQRIPSFYDPLHNIKLQDKEESFELDGTEEGMLSDLLSYVEEKDPDIIYSFGGDEFVFPYLLHKSEKYGIPFELGREAGVFRKDKKSYFSYGRIVYKPSQYLLKGRMHIDTKSSFMFREGGLAGLIELSRLSRIPVQRLSRLSPGTAISSMQLCEAYRRGILIPWHKQIPEEFKTVLQLIKADRGGHILEPKVGIHEDVGEVDFASLYPTIISEFNISPETVLCECCPESKKRVPVLNYNICERKRGFLPNVVKPVILKKALYKGNPELEGRRALLKWVLVTCFGYLGYKNARFGRIECHESVTAYAREILLESMHMAEDEGFEVIHGIVDSLWLKKKTEKEEFEDVCKKISGKIGIHLELEGMYSWIVFLPSKMDVGALNRYYGLIDGEMKVRGIELRMRNQPLVIKKMQEGMLKQLAQADCKREFFRRIPDAIEVVREYVQAVWKGNVSMEDLIFSVGLTHNLEDYKVRNLSVAALKKLGKENVKLFPGQTVRYIIRNVKARKLMDRVSIPELGEETYDKEKYSELLIRAACNILSPFGFNEERLGDYINNRKQTTLRRFYDSPDSEVNKGARDSHICGERISLEAY